MMSKNAKTGHVIIIAPHIIQIIIDFIGLVWFSIGFKERTAGIEPATFCLEGRCSTTEQRARNAVLRHAGNKEAIDAV